MKVTTVLGARPQFIKAAPVSRALRRRHVERLIHTGQHYDAALSDVFFDELGIPAPDHALQVGSGSHGAQTGRMLEAIEAVLLAERPDCVLVYGDTNSTLAGALAAAKLGIALVHVEAGLRSGVRHMPEEINRLVTDRLSDICCCPSAGAVANLASEGITRGVHVVGAVMFDALRDATERVDADAAARAARLEAYGVFDGPYVLATIHRAANTDDPTRLATILAGLAGPYPVLWPVHPRTRAVLDRTAIVVPPNVRLLQPLGYLDMTALLSRASCVATDSGGLQKEAYWLRVPCATLRDETEWIETVQAGWNTLVDADAARIQTRIAQAITEPRPLVAPDAYGPPGAAERVVDAMEALLG